MITIAELASMAKNKKRLSSMLDGTDFKLVHYSVGSPMLHIFLPKRTKRAIFRCMVQIF